jgi:hypothetical protein
MNYLSMLKGWHTAMSLNAEHRKITRLMKIIRDLFGMIRKNSHLCNRVY